MFQSLVIIHLVSLSNACISEDFELGKNTWASSDSYRDYDWALKLIPGLADQGANKFKQGKCGTQSKLVLEETCFKVHHPNTWQHEQYQTRVSEIETLFVKKIESLQTSSLHYDAFLDHNMGFFVREIDSLLTQSAALNVSHWLLTWTWRSLSTSNDPDASDASETSDSDIYDSKQFWSLLVHSPGSQVIYEFVTDTPPEGANELEVLESEMRASFAGFAPDFPWLGESRFHEQSILPIKISRAVSSVKENVDFYQNVLEAQIIGSSSIDAFETVSMGGDDVATKYAFVLNAGASVEIVFVQRAGDYTHSVVMDADDMEAILDAEIIYEASETSDATVASTVAAADDADYLEYLQKYQKYHVKNWEADLVQEHEETILNEMCGFGRWFDNHYGMQFWQFEGLLDRVLTRLRAEGRKYRVFKQEYEHTSDDGKQLLDTYGKDEVHSLWIVEPSGQTFHVGGYLERKDEEFNQPIPTWDPQWCWQACASSSDDSQASDASADVSDVSDGSDGSEGSSDVDESDSEVLSEPGELRVRLGASGVEQMSRPWVAILACVVAFGAVLACVYVWVCVEKVGVATGVQHETFRRVGMEAKVKVKCANIGADREYDPLIV